MKKETKSNVEKAISMQQSEPDTKGARDRGNDEMVKAKMPTQNEIHVAKQRHKMENLLGRAK